MKGYSIIEGCIRQSTNNPINKNHGLKSNNKKCDRQVQRPSAEHGERELSQSVN